ncbi:hypothetical protein D3C81_2172930 [compost metagenome]
MAVDIQVQAGKIDEANKKAQEASQAIVQGRVSYYEKLVNDGVSGGEIAVGALHLAARVEEHTASLAITAGELLKV